MNINEQTTAQEVFYELALFLQDYPITENRTNGKQLLQLTREGLCSVYGSPQGFLIYDALRYTPPVVPQSGTIHILPEVMLMISISPKSSLEPGPFSCPLQLSHPARNRS